MIDNILGCDDVSVYDGRINLIPSSRDRAYTKNNVPCFIIEHGINERTIIYFDDNIEIDRWITYLNNIKSAIG